MPVYRKLGHARSGYHHQCGQADILLTQNGQIFAESVKKVPLSKKKLTLSMYIQFQICIYDGGTDKYLRVLTIASLLVGSLVPTVVVAAIANYFTPPTVCLIFLRAGRGTRALLAYGLRWQNPRDVVGLVLEFCKKLQTT